MNQVILLFIMLTVVCWGHPGHAWDPDGPLEIAKSHPAFKRKSGKLYLGTQLYTGVVIEELEVKNALLEASDIPNSILLSRCAYKEGVPHGTWYEWHKNGFMKKSFHYTKGVLSGIQQEWHQNGRQKSKRDYIMGMPYGLEQHWNEKGEMTKEKLHEPAVEE